MFSLRALAAFVLGTFITVGSAQAAVIDTLDFLYPAVGSGKLVDISPTVTTGRGKNKVTTPVAFTGSYDVFGSLAKNSKIVFTYTLDGSFASASKPVAELFIGGGTLFGKYNAWVDTTSSASSPTGPSALILASANLTQTSTGLSGTATLINKTGSSIYFLAVLDVLKKFTGHLVVSYNVSQVPLPAGFPLFALAMAVIFGLAYRRKVQGSL